MDQWAKQYTRNSEKCIIKTEIPEKVPLKMNELYGIFSILGLGLGLSLIVFTREVWRFKMKNRVRNIRPTKVA
jgi:hypothetical protein